MSNREIKFRCWDKVNQEMIHWYEMLNGQYYFKDFFTMGENGTLMQFTGLLDKQAKEIYEGDIVQYRTPYRTTQTHTGNNIPNGSYTEPMEPGIKEIYGEVKFKDGIFFIDTDETGYDLITPLLWRQIFWDLKSIKEAISWTRQTDNWFDDPEEGDLEYLISECAKVETTGQLIEYLSGFEILGNIYENKNLL